MTERHEHSILLTMVAAALERLEYRTSDPNPDNEDEQNERDGDSASYELLVSDDCLSIRYYYDSGHAGVTICVEDYLDDDPVVVAHHHVDHVRKIAKTAELR